jgi:hypothetical protein
MRQITGIMGQGLITFRRRCIPFTLGGSPMKTLRTACTWSATIAFALILFAGDLVHAQAVCPTARTGRKYKVKIESAPPGATVHVDRKECGPVGVTPLEAALPPGDYTLLLDLDGYQPAQRTFKVVRSRKVQETFVPLIKKADPPRIEVRADADRNVQDAVVALDDVNQGRAPIILTTTPGRHQVVLRKDGFEDFTTWIEVKENEKATLTPVLRGFARHGEVVVDADVSDAEVYIDGNKHADRTPTVIGKVVEGLHVVEVRKEPAIPWKQTVQVVAGMQVKVRAELKSTLGGGGGAIRVLSNVAAAKVFLDGTEMGGVPVDIKDVKVGDHVLEVKAPGYQTREERVTINLGQSAIFKLDLNPAAVNPDEGTLKIVSPVPNAVVFIDGAEAGTVPQEKRVGPGEHFVVVKLEGFKPFEKKLTVDAGTIVTVSAELRAVGKLRVLSTPPGASVTINGQPGGTTPLEAEVEVGDNIIRVEAAGYLPAERTVVIEGGKTETVSAELSKAGPSKADILQMQRGLSHFGARTLARGRATVDMGVGFPFFGEVRINVGAGKVKNFGLDAGVAVRTMLARNEIGLGARFMLVDQEPFSAAAFGDLWWGSKLLDESKRNGATFNLGMLASLTALTHVTITGRFYLNMWSDRHCPALKNNMFDGEAIESCRKYKERLDGGNPADFTAEDATHMEDLTGNSGLEMFERDAGIRLMTSIIAEIAVRQRWNVYAILEGAPFQKERALFTSVFSGSMLESDYGTYARIGVTYKF